MFDPYAPSGLMNGFMIHTKKGCSNVNKSSLVSSFMYSNCLTEFSVAVYYLKAESYRRQVFKVATFMV